jgi:hypothetical protein
MSVASAIIVSGHPDLLARRDVNAGFRQVAKLAAIARRRSCIASAPPSAVMLAATLP